MVGYIRDKYINLTEGGLLFNENTIFTNQIVDCFLMLSIIAEGVPQKLEVYSN